MHGRKMNVKLHNGAKLPRHTHEGAVGFDLCTVEDCMLEPNSSAFVGLGCTFEIPSGCVGLVFPRCGLAGIYGVTLRNGVGVIDSGFHGELRVPLVNLSCDTMFLPSSSSVCMMVVVPFVPCDLVEVDELAETERGEDGFSVQGIE